MNKLSPEILISYLYGELDEATRKQVETLLAASPEAQKELEALQATQKSLQGLEDKVPEEPLVLFAEEKREKRLHIPSVNINGFGKNFLLVAASLAILLLVAAWANLKISSKDGELRISFGEIKEIQDETKFQKKDTLPVYQAGNVLNQEEIKRLINSQIGQNKDSLLAQITLLENKLKQKNVSTFPKTNSGGSYTEAQVKKLLEEMREENLALMLKVIETSGKQQQAYTEQLLASFAKYVDNQRQKDLNNIGLSINNIKTNTEQRFQETDQLLSKIITEVNDKR